MAAAVILKEKLGNDNQFCHFFFVYFTCQQTGILACTVFDKQS